MPDTKISNYTEATTLIDADEIPVVTDVATVPVTKRSLLSTVVTYIVSAIHAATGKTTPVDNDELLLIDSAASYVKKKLTWANVKATLKTYFDTLYSRGTVFVACGGTSSNNPADATTYYFGVGYGGNFLTTPNISVVTFPRAGSVTRIDLRVMMFTALGSSETSTIYFRLNGATDTTISSTFACNTNNVVHLTGLNIAVVAGDVFEIKWVTPTWATNPQGVVINAQVYLE